MNKISKNTNTGSKPPHTEYGETADYFVTLKRFCELTMLGMTTARELAFSKELCEAGISVRLNPSKKQSGIRINWPLYVEHTKKNPTISSWIQTRKTKSSQNQK